MLKNQIALVTGGSKGWGLGIATTLRKAGATVWITGRDGLSLKTACQASGAHPIQADVTCPEDWDKVFSTLAAQSGSRLDILVNNAGAGGLIEDVAKQSDRDILSTIATNLTGAILGTRRAIPWMAERGSGTIINISSIAAKESWPGWTIYGAAKAGLEHFSHGLYTELRPHGIRVTNLTPSWGATEFLSSTNLEERDPTVREKCIHPHEIGELVLHICRQPPHLVVPDVTLLPLVQEIVPF